MPAPVNVDALMREVFVRLLAREGLRRPLPGPDVTLPDGRFLDLRRMALAARQNHGRFGREVWVRRGGWRGRFEGWFKRAVTKLLYWHAWPQIEYNELLARALGECVTSLTALDNQLAALRREASASSGKPSATLGPASPSCAADYYYRFEERFRGSAETIANRQRQYLECFSGRGPVLDAGCGRGEFLSLLRDAGMVGYGVDLNSDMVEHCNRLGLSVTCEDALEHLRTLPEGSLGGVFLAQVIEHLAPDRIRVLLQASRDALAAGGALVAETPNPICGPALRNFYLDPTHIRPVHPELLRFLGEDSGLTLAHYVFTSALAGVEPASRRASADLERHDATGYRDYAAVFVRR